MIIHCDVLIIIRLLVFIIGKLCSRLSCVDSKFDFKMAALRCFFAIKINLVQCILCGQYILADRFLKNSGYLVEHEVLATFGCQFSSKRSFEKSKNTKVCLKLTSK